jgi:hypothetical protein
MAPNAGTLKLLRVVVREDFSRHRCETFIRDLHEVCVAFLRLGTTLMRSIFACGLDCSISGRHS